VKLAEGAYRDELISKILFMCSKEKYALVTDFAWYVGVLQELAVMQGSKHGKEVANQLIEIALRVDSIRAFAVECMLNMVLNDHLILGQVFVLDCWFWQSRCHDGMNLPFRPEPRWPKC
jgi:AP-3 complex subunit delta-1